MKRMQRARQQGMAVIAALLVVAAAAVIATTMLDGQTTYTRILQSEKARTQAHWLLMGGMDWARLTLHTDGKRSPTTRPDQLWATPIVDLRVSQDDQADAALFSGRIDDEQGKYNLWNLARSGRVDPRQVAVLERLLQALDLQASAAPLIARRIALSQALPGGADGTDGPDGGNGTDDRGGAGNTSAAGVAGSQRSPGLQSVDDLRGIARLDQQAVDRLRCCVTILPARTAVNVNTAPPEVLHALIGPLSLGHAMALVADRERGRYFNDEADFVNRLANPDIKLADDSVETGSQWFGVTGVVRLGSATVAMRALLRRDESQATRVVWIREMN
ncbi:Type II secretion system protein K [Bordetella sputigena]|uniref:type II secretion system minor pseudopilin GspK n=1 Tax=Bordetella sputigena TaxID=1416810 RepID=UPI0039EECF7F